MTLPLALGLILGLCILGVLVWIGVSGKTRLTRILSEGIAPLVAQSVEHGNARLLQQLHQDIASSRQEHSQALTHTAGVLQQTLTLGQHQIQQQLTQQLDTVSESSLRRLAEVREVLDRQLMQLQASNAARLDEMRRVVDEKLQATLQQRLGESFRQVADRLEQVHKGLGEMQTLAQGVGDLKHLLGNVRTRGTFGEAQLGSLLEQIFSPEQYAAQVAMEPGSTERVDYAIKLPGRDEGAAQGAAHVWLPIDAKFPTEDFERLLDAQARTDTQAMAAAAEALKARIKTEARSIAGKYIRSPHTTDFAILFLPSESLYAEVLRNAGLLDQLQRELRVTLAGPTTLLAMLNALQMGFRTLALQKRSSEVWQVLGAVKTEFGKFGDVLEKVKSQTQTVLNSLDQAQTRSRAMHRALRGVEALPEAQSEQLLPP